MTLTGKAATREVLLNGRPLNLKESQKICNHSPDGFNWGYEGSGCAQLALAIMLCYVSAKNAMKYYQEFKRDVIAHLPMNEDFEIRLNMIDWLNSRENEEK